MTRVGLDSLLATLSTELELGEIAELDGSGGESVLARLPDAGVAEAELARLAARAQERISKRGALLLAVPGNADDAALSRLRNAIWPAFHATSIVRTEGDLSVRTLSGKRKLGPTGVPPTTILVAHERLWAQSPEATVEKFDKNASGWNGVPGSPGYGHFRWMRRYVGRFATPKPGDRVLDFGCGAGWCGIEACRGVADVELCAFDPSPEMVKIATENARREGIAAFTGRTGFGDDPPFPRGDEEPFDLVISSGVVSFAPSVEGFLDGLAASLRPGATLVIGDINADSRGFRSRRRTKPLVPVREMNAQTAAQVRARLESRGFVHRETAGYQLTWPIPEAMHVSETKLKGLLSSPLLLLNRALASTDRMLGDALNAQFDSWVMRFVAPKLAGVGRPVPTHEFGRPAPLDDAVTPEQA